ncbi:hypothetical protein [Nonomuraea sp. NPDC002799]
MGIDGDAPGPSRRRCGDEGGRPSYDGRLRLPALLAQRPPGSPPLRLRELVPGLTGDLLTHDESAARARTRHVQMVERQIGSTGAPFLRGRPRLHYFPPLWELRAWL